MAVMAPLVQMQHTPAVVAVARIIMRVPPSSLGGRQHMAALAAEDQQTYMQMARQAHSPAAVAARQSMLPSLALAPTAKLSSRVMRRQNVTHSRVLFAI